MVISFLYHKFLCDTTKIFIESHPTEIYFQIEFNY